MGRGSTNDLFSVAGRNVLVTGAASGIGQAIAVGLCAAGANVGGVDVDAAGLARTQELAGPRELVVGEADVTDEAAVAAAFALLDRHHGPPDAVFSNAGIAGPLTPVESLSLADWRDVQSVNLDGSFLVAREAVRAMKAAGKGGKIIFTASVWGHVGTDVPLAAYAASKGAVVNLTRHLAVELAPAGITVNGFSPGGVITNIADGFYEDEEAVAGLLAEIPRGQLVPADALVGLAQFFVASASDHMTGHTIAFDGGFLAH